MMVFLSCVLIIGLYLSISNNPASIEYYVSPNGKEGNTGSLDSPFPTLEMARDAIRELSITDKGSGITVWLLEGRYFLDKPFTLEQRDSGSENGRISYRATKNAKVIFSGGIHLNNLDWRPVRDPEVLKQLPEVAREKVMQLSLFSYGLRSFDPLPISGTAAGSLYKFKIATESPAPNELFCNDEAMQLARWPNNTYTTTGKIINPGAAPRYWNEDIKSTDSNYIPPNERNPNDVPVIEYRDKRADNWVKEEEPWMLIWNNHFSDISVPIRQINPIDHTFTLKYPLSYGLDDGYDKSDKKYFVFNLLEELDQPGEWYLDRKKGIAYLWPTVSIKDATCMLTQKTSAFFELKDASYVTFSGFEIDGGRANVAMSIKGGRDVIIDEVVFKNLAGKAVSVRGGLKHAITGCNIFNTGTGGIYLQGGERKTLLPAGHLVENNHIHNFSRILKSYSQAISIKGVGNSVRHNLIHDADHSAIYWRGNDHVIEYNEIYNVVQTASDMGALYTGRDLTSLGNIIRYNYFHHIGNNESTKYGTQAIFLDDGAQGHQIYGNVFFKAGSNAAVKYHGGVRNVFENNIIIGMPPKVALKIAGNHYPERVALNKTHMDRFNSIDPTSSPWSERWPWLATAIKDKVSTRTNLAFNNVVINTKLGGDGANEYGNLEIDFDPGFINMENNDFTLREDSLVYKELPGFKAIDFKKIGLYER